MNCGKGFFPKKSKLEDFCSAGCKLKYENKRIDAKNWRNKQTDMDVKAKKNAKNKDFSFCLHLEFAEAYLFRLGTNVSDHNFFP